MQKNKIYKTTKYKRLNKVITWFITLRWIACLCVFVTLLILDFTNHFNLPYIILYSLNGLLLFINLAFTLFYYIYKKQNLSEKDAGKFFHIQVCCDYLLLFLIIYFTGFINNPFSYYFVFHIILTSFIFSPSVLFIYVSTLIAAFVSISYAQYYDFLPYFPFFLKYANTSQYFEFFFVKTFGLSSIFIIVAYLVTNIKKRLEEKGKSIEIELNHYKSLDKVKSNFILQVTHELRGPIAAVKGYHEMIIKEITGKIEPKTKETLQKANYRTQNLLTIIDEMIDFAYMKSAEEVKYNKKNLYIKDIIDYNIDLFLTQAKQKNITFSSSCSKNLNCHANRDLLNIIISNLITNAVRYSFSNSTITINAAKEKDQIVLLVRNNGIGIKPENLEKIFDEFFRSRRAREIERDGTGLGLSIIKKAVDSLNGKISVYSEVDKDTSFIISLPVN